MGNLDECDKTSNGELIRKLRNSVLQKQQVIMKITCTQKNDANCRNGQKSVP